MGQATISKELQREFKNHIEEIWKVISDYQGIFTKVHKNQFRIIHNNKLNLITLDAITCPLVFFDGAALEIGETIGLENGELFWHKYTYQYKKSDDIYFRYDKHKTGNNSVMSDKDWNYYHPLCHLHANNEEPRYGTHETNFFEVFHLIRLNFY